MNYASLILFILILVPKPTILVQTRRHWRNWSYYLLFRVKNKICFVNTSAYTKKRKIIDVGSFYTMNGKERSLIFESKYWSVSPIFVKYFSTGVVDICGCWILMYIHVIVTKPQQRLYRHLSIYTTKQNTISNVREERCITTFFA